MHVGRVDNGDVQIGFTGLQRRSHRNTRCTAPDDHHIKRGVSAVCGGCAPVGNPTHHTRHIISGGLGFGQDIRKAKRLGIRQGPQRRAACTRAAIGEYRTGQFLNSTSKGLGVLICHFAGHNRLIHHLKTQGLTRRFDFLEIRLVRPFAIGTVTDHGPKAEIRDSFQVIRRNLRADRNHLCDLFYFHDRVSFLELIQWHF